LILLDSDLPAKVIHLFQTVRREKLHYALARLIKVLSVCTECKQGLVEAGAVQIHPTASTINPLSRTQAAASTEVDNANMSTLPSHIRLARNLSVRRSALTSLLSSSHDSLVLEALWGLRNMSDQAFHLTDTNELLRLLVPLLSSSVEHIAICTAGCLCNLSCGVQALCACMRRFLSREEVTEPVCAALRNVTHRNSRTDTALRQIQSAGALGDIVGLLNADSDPSQLPLVKAVVGLVRNLGLDRDCRCELQKLGATGRLILILKRADGVFEEATRRRGSIVSSSSELSYIEGVRLEDLLELTMVALKSMAMHSPGRSEVIQATSVISLIVRYLYDQSEYLQLASVSLLGEIAVTSDGARAIEEQGAVARITELVQSSNSAVATYSATVLHRIAQSKPVDYQRRLSQELRQSLFDGGVVTGHEAGLSRSTPSGETNPPLPLPRHAVETPLLQLPDVPRDPLPNGHAHDTFHRDSVDGHRFNLLPAKFKRDLRLSTRADGEGQTYTDSVFVEGREAPQLI
uniref:Catenin beta n=1 Tax=Schistocephalus solidus TaxID=70667 RepID=A0A183TF58_SCHSO